MLGVVDGTVATGAGSGGGVLTATTCVNSLGPAGCCTTTGRSAVARLRKIPVAASLPACRSLAISECFGAETGGLPTGKAFAGSHLAAGGVTS